MSLDLVRSTTSTAAGVVVFGGVLRAPRKQDEVFSVTESLARAFSKDEGLPRCHVPPVQESDPAVPEMTRSSPPRPWAQVPAAAVFPLLAWILLAPAGVQAGCSHLVISRYDRVLLPSLLQDAMTDRGDGAVAASLPLQSPVSGPLPGRVVRRRPDRAGGARRDDANPRRIVGPVHLGARPGLVTLLRLP